MVSRTNGSRKTLLRVAGAILTVASLIYVARLLVVNGEALAELTSQPSLWLTALAASLLYAANGCLLTLAWGELVILGGADSLPRLTSLSIYGRAQLVKYVPGNTMHLVGRHALGVQHGIGHRPLLFAAGMELALIALAAVALAGFALGNAGEALIVALPFAVGVPVVVAVWLLAVAGLLLVAVRITHRSEASAGRRARDILRVLVIYGLYCALLGAAMLPTVRAVSEVSAPLIVVSSISLAWVLGLITPGAPSGIGIREAALVIALSPVVGEAEAVLIALAFRIATILGDLGLFVVATAVSVGRPPVAS